jgi:hypothetical protein
MSTPRSKTVPTPPPRLRQLVLPLPDDDALSRRPPPLALVPSLPANRVWKTLSPAQQRTVCQVWLRVLEEVVHDVHG